MPENNIFKKIADFIVNKRGFILIAFMIAVIFCVLSVGKVKVLSDITSLLAEETDTRKGIILMEDEFVTYAAADVMISNITYEKAEEIGEKLKQIENVSSVSFDNTEKHFSSSAALYNITFSGVESDEAVIQAMDAVENALSEYEVSISTSIGQDYYSNLANEMVYILLLAVAVIIAVLLFTSKSYFEVIVLLIVFGVAAILNMGTNYWFGEISSITNSIAIILQLALAIDYAIIFAHRFQDEYDKIQEVKPALIDALAYSIVEISSSSLTTVSGLAALTLMQFRLGYDLGSVLIKGILCSLLTVFLLMPAIIMMFHKALLKTRHKKLVPDITIWGKLITKKVPIFLIAFIIIIPFAVHYSGLCEYAFSDAGTDRIKMSETDEVKKKIHDTFAETNTIALILPRGDYEKEKHITDKCLKLDNVESASGLASIEIDNEKTLTDKFTARAFSELAGIDIEQARLLYMLYGLQNEQYQPITGNSDVYSVPLIDMIEFLFDALDKGAVTLDDGQLTTIEELRSQLTDGIVQLRGENYIRIIFTAAVPTESEESVQLINDIRDIAKAEYDDVLGVGEITSAHKLNVSFASDNKLVNILTILFVFLVLMFTFNSFGASLLLIFVIQGSIWINFSFPYLTHTNLSFVTYLIVSAIQMGAPIDYAIVLYNRFQTNKTKYSPREAMVYSINESFPTILTSGSIMTAAGFIIAYMTTDIYIGSIGLALGRGALISIILVLTVLPQIILLGNRFTEKTTINIRKILGEEEQR